MDDITLFLLTGNNIVLHLFYDHIMNNILPVYQCTRSMLRNSFSATPMQYNYISRLYFRLHFKTTNAIFLSYFRGIVIACYITDFYIWCWFKINLFLILYYKNCYNCKVIKNTKSYIYLNKWVSLMEFICMCTLQCFLRYKFSAKYVININNILKVIDNFLSWIHFEQDTKHPFLLFYGDFWISIFTLYYGQITIC